jgi:hypothetical protein
MREVAIKLCGSGKNEIHTAGSKGGKKRPDFDSRTLEKECEPPSLDDVDG